MTRDKQGWWFLNPFEWAAKSYEHFGADHPTAYPAVLVAVAIICALLFWNAGKAEYLKGHPKAEVAASKPTAPTPPAVAHQVLVLPPSAPPAKKPPAQIHQTVQGSNNTTNATTGDGSPIITKD
jgi:hypothetical protein